MRLPSPRLAAVALALFFAFPACGDRPGAGTATAAPPSIEVYFSPRGGATEAVVRELESAKGEIFLQAYSFTSVPIARALVQAHKRGVKITAVLDKSQRSEKYSSADFIRNAGIATWIDDRHAIAHNKIIVVDRATVITGSFNFTKGAEEKNAENLLVIKGDKSLSDKYVRNFESHLSHSEPYEGREAAGARAGGK
jgi:phosphatidylserine/phosphatidylglycerophosphate/cardiolipin synthase-like enzyme